MKKIPIFQQKGKLPEGKYTIGQVVSPELQAEYQQYISQPWFKVRKPPTFDEWKLQRQKQQESQSVVKSDTRSKYQREQDQKRASVERERRQMKKAQQEAATVAGEVLNRTMPSTIARAAYDAAIGDKSFVGSMIEGNKGLGHPVANLAFDLTSPFILNKGFQLGTKGFKYAWEALPNISLAKTPSGNWNGWINIGNYQYRPNRTSLGMGKLVEREPIIFSGRNGKQPLVQSDLPMLKQMFENGEFKPMTFMDYWTKKPKQVKMYIIDGKQPIEENDLIKILDKAYPRVLSDEEKILAKQAPDIVSRLQQQGINFADDNWFGSRLYSKGKDAVTSLDLNVYHSHLPEYEQLAKSLQESGELYKDSSGKWFGKFSDGSLEVSPEEYIVAHSKAFKNNWYWDGKRRGSAMSIENYNKILDNGGLDAANWVTDNTVQQGIFSHQRGDGPIVQTLVGDKKVESRVIPSKYAHEAENEKFGGITTFDKNIPYGRDMDGNQQSGNWVIFGPNTQVKSLRGNNGDYSKFRRNIYRTIIPTIFGGFVGNLNNNQ